MPVSCSRLPSSVSPSARCIHSPLDLLASSVSSPFSGKETGTWPKMNDTSIRRIATAAEAAVAGKQPRFRSVFMRSRDRTQRQKISQDIMGGEGFSGCFALLLGQTSRPVATGS